MKVTIPNALVYQDAPSRTIHLRYNQCFFDAVRRLFTAAESRHTDQLRVELYLPERRRTTGPRSQNNRIWGHCSEIANQLGEYTAEEVKQAMCRMAVAEGYPTHMSVDGVETPIPTRQATVEQAQVLLDVIALFAAENGLELTEYNDE